MNSLTLYLVFFRYRLWHTLNHVEKWSRSPASLIIAISIVMVPLALGIVFGVLSEMSGAKNESVVPETVAIICIIWVGVSVILLMTMSSLLTEYRYRHSTDRKKLSQALAEWQYETDSTVWSVHETDEWVLLPLPLTHKINLIHAGIRPSVVLTKNVRKMTEEDLAVSTTLQRMSKTETSLS